MFVHFLNKLLKAKETSAQPLFVSCAIVELRNRREYSATHETADTAKAHIQLQSIVRDVARTTIVIN